MTHPLIAKGGLKLVDHRLVWWLLAHQEVDAKGVATGRLAAGWREQALVDLAIPHRVIWAAATRLKAAGILESAKYERAARLLPAAFDLREPARESIAA